MLLRVVTTLATAALTLANPLIARQTTNTNPQIGNVLNQLSVANRKIVFNIVTMQANNTATDGTIGVQVQNLVTAFNGATSDLLAIPVSAGSTDDLPRDIDLSRVLGEAIQVTATGLSGLQAQQSVPNFGNMIGQLDPAVAATINALNTTLPNSLGFVHTLMLDASQFLGDEGDWSETLTALGFE